MQESIQVRLAGKCKSGRVRKRLSISSATSNQEDSLDFIHNIWVYGGTIPTDRVEEAPGPFVEYCSEAFVKGHEFAISDCETR